MIVVTTPTGHIGSQVVKGLLAANERVRVIVRDPKKLSPEVAGKVEVVEGSTDDEATYLRALDGAESLFHVVPPPFATTDVAGHYLGFARAATRAMQSRGVKRAVGVSALGHDYQGDAGLVTTSLRVDEAFAQTGIDYRALWCPSFMENLLNQVEPLKDKGMFFLPADPTRKTRHCATRDIAASGVKLLLDRSWRGQGGLAVLGPEDLSLNDLASIMTDVLKRPIRFQPVPGDAYKATLVQHGASEEFASELVRMFDAKANGLDDSEPRTADNTTPTSFRQWCEDTLEPALSASGTATGR